MQSRRKCTHAVSVSLSLSLSLSLKMSVSVSSFCCSALQCPGFVGNRNYAAHPSHSSACFCNTRTAPPSLTRLLRARPFRCCCCCFFFFIIVVFFFRFAFFFFQHKSQRTIENKVEDRDLYARCRPQAGRGKKRKKRTKTKTYIHTYLCMYIHMYVFMFVREPLWPR